jgi:hypothetical protein
VVVGLLLLSTLDGVPNSITGKGGSSGFVDVGVLEAPALRKLLIRFFFVFSGIAWPRGTDIKSWTRFFVAAGLGAATFADGNQTIGCVVDWCSLSVKSMLIIVWEVGFSVLGDWMTTFSFLNWCWRSSAVRVLANFFISGWLAIFDSCGSLILFTSGDTILVVAVALLISGMKKILTAIWAYMSYATYFF